MPSPPWLPPPRSPKRLVKSEPFDARDMSNSGRSSWASELESEAEALSNIKWQLTKLSEHIGTLLITSQTVDNIWKCVDYLGTLPDEVAKLRADVKLVLQHRSPHDCYWNDFDVKAPSSQSGMSKSACTALAADSKNTSSLFKPKDVSEKVLIQKECIELSMDALDEPVSLQKTSEGCISEESIWKRREERRSRQSRGPNASHGVQKMAYKHSSMFGNFVASQPLDEKEYDVRDLYYDGGLIAHIARSDIFSNLTMCIIVVNALYIGIEADGNRPDASTTVHMVFDIFDNLFCGFFMLEWLIRFLAFANKMNCLQDLCFKFDSTLLLTLIWDTWIMPFTSLDSNNSPVAKGIVNLLRLLRLARICRVVRALPELVAMIRGLKVASRIVGTALITLVMLIYVFSIALFILLRGSTQPFLKSRFERLTTAVWTVLIDGTFLDNVGLVVRNLQEENETVALLTFIIFVLASALTVMNMLIGVHCEVVTSVASAEKENGAVRHVKAQFLGLFQELNEDGSSLISRDVIRQVLSHEAALAVLHDLKVDVESLLAILDMYYYQTEELTVHQIMELILMLRGDSQPTMKHLLQSQQFMHYQFQSALMQSFNLNITL